MELKNNTCSVCGQPLPEAINKRVTCEYCNSTFSIEASLDELTEIKKYIDESKLEGLANARNNLYKVTHEEYLSKDRIRTAVDEVLKLYPSDIMANFYDAFLRNNKNAVNDYLLNFDVEKNKDYLKPIIEFTIKNLDSANVTALKALVDKACDKEDKYNYNTKIEEEAEKLNEGLYNLDIDREVFVCYSSKDIKIVNEITSYLEEQGLSCFVALRNLRHGVGSVENYQESIYKAMRNSKCLLFLSSTNSRRLDCDALRYELPYLKNNLKDKKRIEYLVEDYTDNENAFAKRLIKQVFEGLEWSKSKDDLIDRLMSTVFDTPSETKKVEQSENVKYCVNCFTKNPLSSKFCLECGGSEFKDTLSEAKEVFKNKYNNSVAEEKKKKFCTSCLTSNDLENAVCSECGSSDFRDTLNEATLVYKKRYEDKFNQEAENHKLEAQKREEERLRLIKEKEEAEKLAKEKEEERKRLEAEKQRLTNKPVTLSNLKKGMTIEFGSYPQNNSLSEPILWDVIDVQKGTAYLIAHNILDAHRFDSKNNDYKNSEIRSWLNNTFFNKAFNQNEKDNIIFNIDSYNDNVSLPSLKDVTNLDFGFKYGKWSKDKKRAKAPTRFAISNGLRKADNGNGWYYLRDSKEYDSNSVWNVKQDGDLNDYGYINHDGHGIVPAIWVKQNSSNDSESTIKNSQTTVKSTTSSVNLSDLCSEAYKYTQQNNYNKAFELYYKAANLGSATAQNWVGWLYQNGKGVNADYNEAFKWYKKSADQGHVDAYDSLGYCYYNGHGTKVDYAESFKWYKKAAENNDATAQYWVGWFYEQGKGVKVDYNEAFKWYKKSADQGHVGVYSALGYCYYSGRGTKIDYAESFKWYKKAADNNDATAQYWVGWFYEHGKGVNVDYNEAFKWYKKSADQGHVGVYSALGYCYYSGRGAKVDYAEAFKWYKKAAENNDSTAQNWIGWFYQNGKGVNVDYNEAFKWYKKAVDNGNTSAIDNLAYLYVKGYGTKTDYAEAFKLYKKAAENNDDTAQNWIGWFYEYGKGVPYSLKEAITWYKKSASNGNESAKTSLKRLGVKL